MCHAPTKEEVALSEARRAASTTDEETRADPSRNNTPRGNQDADEREVERSVEKLASVLGH